MDKNTQKTPLVNNPKIEYLGLRGFALVWLKVIALTAVIVLVLKYIFKVPNFILKEFYVLLGCRKPGADNGAGAPLAVLR